MIAAMAFRLIYLMLVRVLSCSLLFTRQTPPRTSRSSCSATRSRSSRNAHRPSSPWADRALLSAVPSLGHLAPRMITNGAVDRAVHGWIADDCSRSTVKNSIAVLVRDGILDRNPARISGWQDQFRKAEDELDDPRSLALPDWSTLTKLADALVARSADHHRGWGDVTIFAACTAARIGEVFD